jgi:small subunit ribosomal protein S18
MARNNDRGSSSRRAPKDAGRRIKKKPCSLCKDRVEWVDYKDVAMLRKFMSDRGKIRARRVSGNCTQHQRDVAIAIKTARELVLLPYTQRTTTERPGGRGRGGYGAPGGGRRGRDGERSPVGETTTAAAAGAGADGADSGADAGEAEEVETTDDGGAGGPAGEKAGPVAVDGAEDDASSGPDSDGEEQ